MLRKGTWGRNDAAGDEILHAVGTCDPHLVRTVPVEIQGEGRRRVTQILLDRLDVVPGAEGVDRVSVPQVVDADAGHIQRADNLFETVVQRAEGCVAPQLVGEHQVVLVVPGASRFLRPLTLQRLLFPEQIHHIGRGHDQAALSVLCGVEAVLSVFVLALVELLVDEDAAPVKVHTVPHEPQQFALPQAGEHEHNDHDPIAAVLNGRQQLVHLLVRQRLDLLFENPGRHTVVAGVCADIAEADGLLKNTVELPMYVLDGLGRQRLFPIALFAERVVQVLDHPPVQVVQTDIAQRRPDVQIHGALIVEGGGVLEPDGVILQPDVQPFVERHGAGGDIGSLVNFIGDPADLLADCLLGLAVDGPLDLLAGGRIETDRVAALPAAVGALPDRSAAVGGACCFVVRQ